MTGIAKHIGRIGALAVALGVGLLGTGAPASAADVPPTTALIMGGTTVPRPDDAYIEVVKSHYIAPTHPGQQINYFAVATPEELWPFTGALRLVATGLGPPYAGFDSPVWPEEPWWKLSGLFDLTMDQSVQAGLADLEVAMAEAGDDHLVIYGLSQGATIANLEKRRLAEQYPDRDTAPDIDFVLGGDPNLPNGGLYARFPGLYLPILDWTFTGPEATDTPFDTVVITRQYDAFADFPLYPLNPVADLNAVLGFIYVHMYSLDVTLAPDTTAPPPTHSEYGNTDYYFFPTEDLPLFGPLRTLGVPEPVIDVFEPFFRVIVEQGYDRSIPAWQPTPARLIPKFEPAKLATDLVDAIGEGIDNAGALVKPAASLKLIATSTNRGVNEDVQKAELQTNESVGAVQPVVDGGNTVRSSDRSNTSTAFKDGHARPTPLRDAVKTLSSGVKNVVDKVSDNIKKAVTASRDAGSQPQGSTDG